MQKEKKVFDATTARKLITDYADKLNIYMKENQNLKNQIEDIKMTLKINKDLLFKYISTNVQQSEQLNFLNEYKNDNLKLSEKNEKLHLEKINLEKKLYKFQQEAEDNQLKLRDDMEKLKDEIFVLKNKINEKDTSISIIKKEHDTKFPASPHVVYKELFITEPTRVNLELNNELNYTRELISKVSKMMNNEKIKNEKLEGKFSTINDELSKLKKCQSEMDKSIGTVIFKKNSENDLSDSQSLTEDEDLDLSLDDDENQIDTETDIQFPVKVNYNSLANSANTINVNTKSPIDLLNKQNKNSFISNFKSHNPNPDKNTNHKKSGSFIPKLDLKIIQNKYETESLKEKAALNNSIIDDKKKGSQGNNKSDDESAKIIEKLKNEIRIGNRAIKEMKEKIEKFKNAYKSTKAKLKFANQNLKISNNKITNLEAQIKKAAISSITIGGQSTDDLSNKRIGNTNTSMNNYTGRSNEEIDTVLDSIKI